MSQENQNILPGSSKVIIPRETNTPNTSKQKVDTANLDEVQLHPVLPVHSSEISYLLQHDIHVTNKDTSAVIGPVGLMGFALTTFLLNLHNAGVFPMSPVILGMGIAYGGLAQFLAGVFEYIKGNSFTSVAFISYGAFWWSYVLIFSIPKWGWCEGANADSLACYLLIWLVFSIVMTFASFTKPWVIRFIFILLSLLFLFLVAGEWSEKKTVTKVAGVIGIIDAITAMYAGAAEIINGAWGMTILPLGAPGEKWLAKHSE